MAKVRRAKSHKEITEQILRLRRANYERTGEFRTGRDKLIEDIGNRYQRNIARAIGTRMPMRSDAIEAYEIDPNRKVSRRTYMGLSAG